MRQGMEETPHCDDDHVLFPPKVLDRLYIRRSVKNTKYMQMVYNEHLRRVPKHHTPPGKVKIDGGGASMDAI